MSLAREWQPPSFFFLTAGASYYKREFKSRRNSDLL